MEIVLGEWFTLPRLGSQAFTKLTREAGLKYDKQHGFKADSGTNLYTVSSILRSALGEEVEFVLKCFVCGEKVECEVCTYRDRCDRRLISSNCICNTCRGKEDTYTLYAMHFADLAEH